VAALDVHGLREHRRGRGEQRLLAHFLQPLVACAKTLLGRLRLAGQHLHERLLLRDRRVEAAELAKNFVAGVDEPSTLFEVTLHRVQ
jgi:hypothetical protein